MRPSTPPEHFPERLLDGGDGSPEHTAARMLLANLPEPQGDSVDLDLLWREVQRPQRFPIGRREIGAGLLLAGGVAAVLFFVFPAPPTPPVEPQRTRLEARIEWLRGDVSVVGGETPGHETPGQAALAAGTVPEAAGVRTGDGQAILDASRARVLLSANSGLSLGALGEATALRLRSGRVLADVQPRARGETFTIEAGGDLVTVKGTLFQVSVDDHGTVSVSCARGLVVVSNAAGQWSVPAGQAWRGGVSGPLLADEIAPEDRRTLEGAGEGQGEGQGEEPMTPSPEPTPAPTALPPPPSAHPPTAGDRASLYDTALSLDRAGRHHDAASLLREVVSRHLPNADLALYQLAQLEQGPLENRAEAERDYLRYEADYPHGSLNQEAALSAIQLILDRRDYRSASLQMDKFLREHPASERASKVHLLHGNVDRALGDPAAALAQYAEVQGRDQDEALFFSAECQAALGHTDAASALLRSYLDRYPGGQHVMEARSQLSR